jgi:hypothetical protein
MTKSDELLQVDELATVAVFPAACLLSMIGASVAMHARVSCGGGRPVAR